MVQIGRFCDDMNNAEKNTYAKRQIKQAIIALLKEKDLNAISIGEIAEKAGVSRNAFYRNYDSKEGIIIEHTSNLLKEWHNEFQKNKTSYDIDFYGGLFQHFYDNKEFYLLLKKRELFHLVLKSLIALFGNLKELDNIAAYSVAYIAYGAYGWIQEWVERGMVESPETISAILASLLE